MYPLCFRIHHAFDAAQIEYRRLQGVSSAPFWKLCLHDLITFDSECLRLELCDALITGSFRHMHVPAFLTFVQTKAAGHGYRLWEETVIPLLSGTGDERTKVESLLREAFDGQHSFHSALRTWLKKNGRADIYTVNGFHFWFVHAVIGECALAGISKEFAEKFLGSLFRENRRSTELRRQIQERFRSQLETFGRSRERREVQAIEVLEDCLVEAGLVVTEIIRILKNVSAPIDGWNVEELLNLCRKTGNVRLGALPPVVVEVIRELARAEVKNLNMEQLFDLLRRNPESRIREGTLEWSLSNLQPPPITPAGLWQGANLIGRFNLVDDLGRGADELLTMPPSSGWEITGDVVWKLASHPFQASHPSRMRSQARPILRTGEDVTNATRWVLTLNQKEFSSNVEPLRNKSGQFFLRAWPALDNDSKPIFFVRGFYLPAGWARTARLEFQDADRQWQSVWDGTARVADVVVRRPVVARPGEVTIFRLVGNLNNGEQVSREVKFSWTLPALFSGRRRIPSGMQLAPSQEEFCLFCVHTPVVEGCNESQSFEMEPVNASWKQYRFSRLGSRHMSVRVDGECWEFVSRPPVTVRAWFEPTTTQEPRPDRTRYRASEEVDVFFRDVPVLVLDLQANGASHEELLAYVGATTVVAGNDDEFGDIVRIPLAELLPETSAGIFRLSLSGVIPRSLVEPGFNVRWVRLLDGSMDPASNDVGELPGIQLQFIVLPYAIETILPRRPGTGGQLRLDDPSNTFEPLIFDESGGNLLPLPHQSRTPQIRVGTAFSFLGSRLEALVTFPLCGCWFKESHVTVADLDRFYTEESDPCALVIVPDSESLTVRLEGLEGQVIATRTIYGPCSQEMNFFDICPITKQASAEEQRRWLITPGSRIVCVWKELECGQVELDHRGAVISFVEFERMAPDPIGATDIQLEICYLKGLSSHEELDLVLTNEADETSLEIHRRSILFSGGDFEVIQCREALTLPRPGSYTANLCRSKEQQTLATLELQGENPSPPRISLEELLELLPESPELEQVIRLYRHMQINCDLLQGDRAPWSGCTCYSRLDGLWHSSTSNSRAQRLIGILRAYSDGLRSRPLGPVEPVSVLDARGAAFLEIATVMLHLYHNTESAIRRGLDEWEREIDKYGREPKLDPAARCWSEILLNACRKLQNKPALSTTVYDDSSGGAPWFPCKSEFLRFLQGTSPCLTQTVLSTQ